MKKASNLIASLMVALIVLAACSGGGGGGGTSGDPAREKNSVAYAVVNSAPIATCPNGGITVYAGIDTNGSGVLDQAEFTGSPQYVCNGANGIPMAVSLTTLPAGTTCVGGGANVCVGPDANADNLPDSTLSCQAVCNGPTGPTGPTVPVIQSITADPPVVRPGQSTMLAVFANDGAGRSLTYAWSAAQGSLTSTSTGTTSWIAPDSVGSYLVSVQVSNGTSSVTGYATILVSVSPTGPIITSVSPSETRTGDTITITGAGFGATQGSSTVMIGGSTDANVTSWSENQVKATVPPGAVTGAVVITEGGVDSSPGFIAIPWSDGNLNLTDIGNNQFQAKIVADGSGGAIIVWVDGRDGNLDIYAQRVNSAGIPQWTADGVAISTAARDQSYPDLVPDGAGGAIFVWEDSRIGGMGSLDIYAQRVNSAGTVQWTANGIPISTATNNQSLPHLVPDASGGAIIAWEDSRNGVVVNSDIYAQRVNSAGIPQWTADGVAISTATGNQLKPQLVAVGSGGAIITWQDYRNGTDHDIYAQRVNSTGTIQWTTNGTAISTAIGNQINPQLVPDGSGGAIITWQDYRNGNSDIYAQRVNSSGAVQWTSNGVVICIVTDDQENPQLVPDGFGGAILTWEDFRSFHPGIYAQRVNSVGEILWNPAGVAICYISTERYPQIIQDGSGGAIITWQDSWNADNNIYAQRVDGAGITQWMQDGNVVAVATDDQLTPQLASDGSGGAIVTWQDNRSGMDSDIYTQRIGSDGNW